MFNLNKILRFYLFYVTPLPLFVCGQKSYFEMSIISIVFVFYCLFPLIMIIFEFCLPYAMIDFIFHLTLNFCIFVEWAEIFCNFYLTFFILNRSISFYFPVLPFLLLHFSLISKSIFLSSLFSSSIFLFALFSSLFSSHLQFFSSLLFRFSLLSLFFLLFSLLSSSISLHISSPPFTSLHFFSF